MNQVLGTVPLKESMMSGVFGPYCNFTDKIRCPQCNKVQQISELQVRGMEGTPPWYVCACHPDDPIVVDPGDGRIQLFEEMAQCLVSSP